MQQDTPKKAGRDPGVNGGHAHHGHPFDDPAEYAGLAKAEQEALREWIGRELAPAEQTGAHSSYGLKHIFERLDGGFYVVNGAFKGAMLAAGYEPVDPLELPNWRFRYRLLDPLLWERSVGRA